jgi:L-ascorbate oxidase
MQLLAEGGYGMLIVREKEILFQNDYEYSLLISDWYHIPIAPLQGPLSNYGPTSAANNPPTGFQWPGHGQAILVSGIGQCLSSETGCSQNFSVHKPLIVNVKPNKTYRIRIVNAASLGFFTLGIAGHNMTVVKKGSTDIEPVSMRSLDIGGGERFDVLVTFDKSIDNYPLHIISNYRGNDTTAAGVYNFTLFRYDGAPEAFTSSLSANLEFKSWDQMYNQIRPRRDSAPVILLDPKVSITIDSKHAFVDIHSRTDINSPGKPFSTAGKLSWIVNNYSFAPSETPHLLASYYNLINKDDYTFYPPASRPYRIEYNSDVQIVIQNYASRRGICENHPWHLHGNKFYFVGYGSGKFNGTVPLQFLKSPLLSDNIVMMPSSLANTRTNEIAGNGADSNAPCGFIVLRLKADNPGMWLFHCHISWHMSIGMQFLLDIASEMLWRHRNLRLPVDYGTCGRVTAQTTKPSYIQSETETSKECSDSTGVIIGTTFGSFIAGLAAAYMIFYFYYKPKQPPSIVSDRNVKSQEVQNPIENTTSKRSADSEL